MNLSALDCKFSVLDELPDRLYAEVITHSHGELIARCSGILQWRAYLLKGELPCADKLTWPEYEVRKKVLMRLDVIDIVQYCYQQEELTDNLLITLLESIESTGDYLEKTNHLFNDKQAQQQKTQNKDSQFEGEDGDADHIDPAPQDQQRTGNTHPENGGNADQKPLKNNSETLPTPISHIDTNIEPSAAPHLEQETRTPSVNSLAPLSQPQESIDNAPTPVPILAHEDAENTSLETPPSHPTGDPSEILPRHETAQGTALNLKQPKASSDLSSPDHRQLEKQWGELAQSWHELSSVFTELGGLLGK